MRHLAYAEIKKRTIPFSLSNSTSKVAHFLTTIFGSIYHDRKQGKERNDPFDIEPAAGHGSWGVVVDYDAHPCSPKNLYGEREEPLIPI